MSSCDPAYETCPADNSTTTDAPAVAAFNPLIYAWGLIPVLDFVAGMGNKNAINSWLTDFNVAGNAFIVSLNDGSTYIP